MKSILRKGRATGLIFFLLLLPLTLHAESSTALKSPELPSSPNDLKAPLNIAFAINLAPNLDKQDLKVAHEAVFAAVTMLRAEDTVSLLDFGNSTHRILSSRSVSNSQVLLSGIRKLAGQDSANLFVAVSKAAREIRSSPVDKKVHHIILVLSNQLTFGEFSKFDLQRLLNSLAQDDISHSILCLGDTSEKSLGVGIETESIRCTYVARRIQELKKLLEEELIRLGAQS